MLAPAGAGERRGPRSISASACRSCGITSCATSRSRSSTGCDRRHPEPPARAGGLGDLDLRRGGTARRALARCTTENLGKPGAPSVVGADGKRAEDEGWGLTTAIEGDAIYTAYSRVKGGRAGRSRPGFRVAEVDGGGVALARRPSAAGSLLSLAIGMRAALARGAQHLGPDRERCAPRPQALGRREPFAAPATAIVEIQRGRRARSRARRRSARAASASASELLRASSEARARGRGREPREGRVPRDARPRAAQSARRASRTRCALLEHAGAPIAETAPRARAIIARQTAHLARLTDDLLDVGPRDHGQDRAAPPAARPRRARRARARARVGRRAARRVLRRPRHRCGSTATRPGSSRSS